MSGMTAWRFADPIWFGLIPCLAVVVYVALVGRRQERLRFSDVGLAASAQGGRGQLFRLIPLALRLAVLFLVIVAMARPQGGAQGQEVLSEGVDIMLVADTSGSMEAMDFTLGGQRATRLDVVKKVIREFVGGRVNDRIGLVVFGEEAFVQCPTTLDYGILVNTLDAVRLKMAGDGTAIGSALGTAVQSLEPMPGKSKIVILLTDGKNTTGILDPQQAARAAATYGIKVYTIGVGTDGEAPFLTQGLFGGKQFVYQKVEMDEPTLKAIAHATGARYFRADSSESLAQIFALIDDMEKTKVEVREWVDYEELFRSILLPALFLLMTELVLRATWLRTLPG